MCGVVVGVLIGVRVGLLVDGFVVLRVEGGIIVFCWTLVGKNVGLSEEGVVVGILFGVADGVAVEGSIVVDAFGVEVGIIISC